MADDIPVLSRSTTHGPLPAGELAVLGRLGGLGAPHGPTPDATVVLDGTTVRLGPAATTAVLDLLGRLAGGAVVTVAEQNRWLNTSQAARLAGVSNTYLRQLADRGEIPVTYRGTHRRIHPEDVLAWVRRREEARAQEERARDSRSASGDGAHPAPAPSFDEG
ncbi:DNA-binding protein [Citricoccus sp. SGAir0253]|uniref:helix-turn-helix domain-containing protein n=1 Tax=Citricoccus sp. SGAir0253 TaxID=2567881 RepID=UPI0010CCD044|nr:helix-turn-helix domain-containing protein [Citricoccus sp. SGAir0253]QCU77089.1 DNA-binding protein [Citricoccus sp. SGAir0253]